MAYGKINYSEDIILSEFVDLKEKKTGPLSQQEVFILARVETRYIYSRRFNKRPKCGIEVLIPDPQIVSNLDP